MDADEDDPQSHHSLAARWVVVAAIAIVVVGMVVGILLFNSAAPDAARGAASARQAAQQYVAALNGGDRIAATAISCDTFANDARSAARSGADPSLDYTLDKLIVGDRTSSTAMITEHWTLPGGTRQHRPADVAVLRSSGRWLVCGRAP